MSNERPRTGPRPLPLHAFAAWRAHTLAIAALGGAPLLDQDLLERIERARASGAHYQLVAAVLAETASRWGGFWEGIARYCEHPYSRADADRPVFLRDGNARLFAFAESGPPILAVPSLVNSSDVLDLLPDRSLMRTLAAAGFRPFLVDWGAPEADAADWTVDRYVTRRLAPMAAAVREATGETPILVGYCMGGLLAAALAALRPEDVRGLALLATPWDFHAPSPDDARMVAGMAGPFGQAAAASGGVPADLLQVLFFALDPTLAARKYRRFARMDQTSEAARLFVAMEDWVNGGPDLAAPVAEAVLKTWYGENATATGRWRVGGRIVDGRSYPGPLLIAAPNRDRIVPPESARAFAVGADPARTTLLDVRGGHVGMIVGHESARQLWEPLTGWLRKVAT